MYFLKVIYTCKYLFEQTLFFVGRATNRRRRALRSPNPRAAARSLAELLRAVAPPSPCPARSLRRRLHAIVCSCVVVVLLGPGITAARPRCCSSPLGFVIPLQLLYLVQIQIIPEPNPSIFSPVSALCPSCSDSCAFCCSSLCRSSCSDSCACLLLLIPVPCSSSW